MPLEFNTLTAPPTPVGQTVDTGQPATAATKQSLLTGQSGDTAATPAATGESIFDKLAPYKTWIIAAVVVVALAVVLIIYWNVSSVDATWVDDYTKPCLKNEDDGKWYRQIKIIRESRTGGKSAPDRSSNECSPIDAYWMPDLSKPCVLEDPDDPDSDRYRQVYVGIPAAYGGIPAPKIAKDLENESRNAKCGKDYPSYNKPETKYDEKYGKYFTMYYDTQYAWGDGKTAEERFPDNDAWRMYRMTQAEIDKKNLKFDVTDIQEITTDKDGNVRVVKDDRGIPLPRTATDEYGNPIMIEFGERLNEPILKPIDGWEGIPICDENGENCKTSHYKLEYGDKQTGIMQVPLKIVGKWPVYDCNLPEEKSYIDQDGNTWFDNFILPSPSHWFDKGCHLYREADGTQSWRRKAVREQPEKFAKKYPCSNNYPDVVWSKNKCKSKNAGCDQWAQEVVKDAAGNLKYAVLQLGGNKNSCERQVLWGKNWTWDDEEGKCKEISVDADGNEVIKDINDYGPKYGGKSCEEQYPLSERPIIRNCGGPGIGDDWLEIADSCKPYTDPETGEIVYKRDVIRYNDGTQKRGLTNSHMMICTEDGSNEIVAGPECVAGNAICDYPSNYKKSDVDGNFYYVPKTISEAIYGGKTCDDQFPGALEDQLLKFNCGSWNTDGTSYIPKIGIWVVADEDKDSHYGTPKCQLNPDTGKYGHKYTRLTDTDPEYPNPDDPNNLSGVGCDNNNAWEYPTTCNAKDAICVLSDFDSVKASDGNYRKKNIPWMSNKYSCERLGGGIWNETDKTCTNSREGVTPFDAYSAKFGGRTCEEQKPLDTNPIVYNCGSWSSGGHGWKSVGCSDTGTTTEEGNEIWKQKLIRDPDPNYSCDLVEDWGNDCLTVNCEIDFSGSSCSVGGTIKSRGPRMFVSAKIYTDVTIPTYSTSMGNIQQLSYSDVKFYDDNGVEIPRTNMSISDANLPPFECSRSIKTGYPTCVDPVYDRNCACVSMIGSSFKLNWDKNYLPQNILDNTVYTKYDSTQGWPEDKFAAMKYVIIDFGNPDGYPLSKINLSISSSDMNQYGGALYNNHRIELTDTNGLTTILNVVENNTINEFTPIPNNTQFYEKALILTDEEKSYTTDIENPIPEGYMEGTIIKTAQYGGETCDEVIAKKGFLTKMVNGVKKIIFKECP